MLCDAPRKQHVFQFLFGWRFLRHDFQVFTRDAAKIAVLHQEAASDRFHEPSARCRVWQAFRNQEAEIFLFGEDGLSRFISAGGDDDLGEDLGDFCRSLFVQRAVQGHDAAKGRRGVAGQSRAIGFNDAGALRHAARIGVLDDGDGWCLGAQFADQFIGRVGIVDIVVGQFLAL